MKLKKDMKFISPWIHTTDKCNLSCHYCYVKGDDIMKPEIYDYIGKLTMEAPADKIHLRFAGGEPTLVFDLWEPFARSMLNYDKVSIEVLTNLHNPPKKFWKFTELSGVGISVSIDNDTTMKVLNKSIVEKLKRLNSPWIMTTLTKENIKNLDILSSFIG